MRSLTPPTDRTPGVHEDERDDAEPEPRAARSVAKVRTSSRRRIAATLALPAGGREMLVVLHGARPGASPAPADRTKRVDEHAARVRHSRPVLMAVEGGPAPGGGSLAAVAVRGLARGHTEFATA